MKGQLPSSVRFTLVRKGRNAEFSYEEDFGNATLIKRTVKVIEPLLPKGVKVMTLNKGKTVRLHGSSDYAWIAEFIMHEFMAWSTIMEMKLRDILLSGVATQSRAIRAERALDEFILRKKT